MPGDGRPPRANSRLDAAARSVSVALISQLLTVGLFSFSSGCRPPSHHVESRQTSGVQSLSDTSSSTSSPSLATFRDRDCPALAQCDYHNGKEAQVNCILEIVGGGVGCVDYDLDGSIDLFFPRGGRIDAENRQVTGINSAVLQGDGKWNFSDRTQPARVDTARIYSHGITAADFDHDGFHDLLVYGYRGVILLQNQGDGTFRDLTRFDGPAPTAWTTAAAWIDVNGDQSLDLYLGSYVDWDLEHNQACQSAKGEPDVCSPNVYEGSSNSAYINNCDGSFSFAQDLLQTAQPPKTLGVLAAEFTPGQGTGLYVTNDLVPNFLFTRPGKGDSSQLEEHAFASGAAVDDVGVANGSMGVALLDFNLDRRFDLFVTNFEHEMMALYVNAGSDSFHHLSRQAGLNKSDLRLVGFGTVAGDFDGDADEDIVFTAGHVHYHPTSNNMQQLPAYLDNVSGQTLVKSQPKCRFFTEPVVGRGLAAADLDNDGDLDLVATHLFGPPALVENSSRPAANWLSLTLVGTDSPRTPLGATVELTAGATTLVRQLYGGGSYLSQSEPRLHFAWPADTSQTEPATLTIRWPGKAAAESVTVEPNRHLVIVQGKNAK